MNIFYSIFFAGVHPNARIWDFRLEIFNEWSIQIMCFHLICFTDMVKLDTEPLINYKIGESFKLFAMFVIIINLLTISTSMIHPIKSYLRKRSFRNELPKLISERMIEREA